MHLDMALRVSHRLVALSIYTNAFTYTRRRVEREREDIESKTCGAHIKSGGARASRARKQPGARCNGCNLNIMQMTAKLSSQIPLNDKVLAREEIKIENMPCFGGVSRDPTP